MEFINKMVAFAASLEAAGGVEGLSQKAIEEKWSQVMRAYDDGELRLALTYQAWKKYRSWFERWQPGGPPPEPELAQEPPIVYQVEGERVLYDGAHRLEEAISRGDQEVDVVVSSPVAAEEPPKAEPKKKEAKSVKSNQGGKSRVRPAGRHAPKKRDFQPGNREATGAEDTKPASADTDRGSTAVS